MFAPSNKRTGASKTPSVGPFAKFVFPLIRRTAPQLIANNIVSVQPMTSPVGGLTFYGKDTSPPIEVGHTVRSKPGYTTTAIIGVVVSVQKDDFGLDEVVIETIDDRLVTVPAYAVERVSPLEVVAEASNQGEDNAGSDVPCLSGDHGVSPRADLGCHQP